MKKIIALFLAVTMLTCSTVTANAEGLNSKETPAEITTKTTDISTGEIEDVEVQKNPSVFVGDNFEVSFHVTSKWDTAFNANVTITNTSDTGIDNWAVQFDIPHKITNIWNGVIDSKESGTYIIKNTGYNKKLNPGSSVSFGFSADTTEGKIVYPVSYDLLGTQIQSTLDTSEIGFQVTNDWKFAFNGEIQIKNISEKPIEDWQLEFDFDHNITSFWEANILSHEGNHYIIKNRGYNANIQPGKTLVLGFHGNPGNVEIEPKNYVLTYMGMETEEEIQIDLNGEYNPIENKIDLSWICNNEQLLFDVLISNDDEKYSVITSIENKNSYTYNIVDNNTDFYFKIRFIQEDGVVVESKTLYFQQIINDETDTDGDGLSDY